MSYYATEPYLNNLNKEDSTTVPNLTPKEARRLPAKVIGAPVNEGSGESPLQFTLLQPRMQELEFRMKAKKLAVAMTAFALAALVVGVLVWPQPKPALAQNVSVTIFVDNWNGVNPYNIQATAEALDAWGIELNPRMIINLNPNLALTEFGNSFVNPPSGAAKVRLTWDPLNLHEWSNGEPPQTITLNWSGTSFHMDCN